MAQSFVARAGLGSEDEGGPCEEMGTQVLRVWRVLRTLQLKHVTRLYIFPEHSRAMILVMPQYYVPIA